MPQRPQQAAALTSRVDRRVGLAAPSETLVLEVFNCHWEVAVQDGAMKVVPICLTRSPSGKPAAITRLRYTRSIDLRAALATFLSLAALLGLNPARAAERVPLGVGGCQTDRLFGHGFGEDGEVGVGVIPRSFNGRTYYLVVPPSYRPQAGNSMLLALHGTGGNAAGADSNALAIAQAWQNVSRRAGLVVAVPIGSSPMGSWNPSVDSFYIDQLRASLEAELGTAANRQYLWGFSAGGHFGHGYTLARTGIFAAYAVAAGVLRGFACESQANPQSCMTYLDNIPRHIPVDIRSGTSDPIVRIQEISADDGRFRSAGWIYGQELLVTGYPHGHTYSAQQISDSWNRLCLFSLPPGA